MIEARAATHLEIGPVEQLTKELLACVRDHYMRRPTSRSTSQEVLNAAAIVVSVIYTAARECGDEDGVREFFDLAVEQQMADGESLPTTLGALNTRLKP